MNHMQHMQQGKQNTYISNFIFPMLNFPALIEFGIAQIEKEELIKDGVSAKPS